MGQEAEATHDLHDVLYQKDTASHIATITLNRPDRMNALGGSLEEDLHAALRAAEADQDVQAVILTGAGKGFCGGLDLKERAAGHRRHPGTTGYLRANDTPRIMLDMNKVVIAAVNGPAVGWGFELALLCDYRIGSEAARMGDAHARLGVAQDNGAFITLPRIIGWSRAIEVLLTGEVFNAQQLLDLGILNKVVPAGELLPAARAFAERITCNAPVATRMIKRLMRMGQRSDLDDALDYSMILMGSLMNTEDAREGFGAQAEKRKPKFKGR